MTTAELDEQERHKIQSPPKPDLAAELATDQAARDRVPAEILAVLSPVPVLLRDIAIKMHTGDDGEPPGERQLDTTMKRLRRLIMNANRVPGVLHPFAMKQKVGRTMVLATPYRLYLPPTDSGLAGQALP